MLEALFGPEMLLRVVVAILIFAAVMMAFWGIRRLSATRSGGNAVRGRQPRLAIMDAAAIDTRRRLVLVRRDNVEHLLMIGGPSDVVIEQNIVRAAAPKEVPAPRVAGWPEPGSRPVEPSPAIRPNESPESWPEIGPGRLEPARPEPAARADPIVRSEPHPEPTRPARQHERQYAEAAGQAEGVEPAEAPRRPLSVPVAARPVPPPAAPAESEEPQPSDAELTEMAQRLEAALRRPMNPASERSETPAQRPPAPPEITHAGGASALPFGAPSPSREAKTEPTRSPPPTGPFGAPQGREAPKVEPRPPAPDAPRPAPDPKSPPRSVFDSLEQEMASLLGRPVGKE